jgi:hypothetical protein
VARCKLHFGLGGVGWTGVLAGVGASAGIERVWLTFNSVRVPFAVQNPEPRRGRQEPGGIVETNELVPTPHTLRQVFDLASCD